MATVRSGLSQFNAAFDGGSGHGRRLSWVRSMPVRQMVAGALPSEPRDGTSRYGSIAFFGFATVDAYRVAVAAPAGAFRQSGAHRVNADALAAWLRLGEIAAQDRPTVQFDREAFDVLVSSVKSMTRMDTRQALARLVLDARMLACASSSCQKSKAPCLWSHPMVGAASIGAVEPARTSDDERRTTVHA